jgi:lauroyl/myristoyl acyltransferase
MPPDSAAASGIAHAPQAKESRLMAALPKREELFEAFMVKLLRRMPLTWASWLGGEIGAMRGRAALKSTSLWVQRLRRNIAQFSGISDPAEIDRRVIGFTRNIGRLYAEYPNLRRLFASGRVEIVGEENLNDAKEPGILLCCHVGNWELVAALAQRWGGATIPYLPLGGGLRERIALEARRAWPDLELIPASNDALTGIDAVMRLNQAARQGKTLAIFVDEERQNYIWALAGRAPRGTASPQDRSDFCRTLGACALSHRHPTTAGSA